MSIVAERIAAAPFLRVHHAPSRLVAGAQAIASEEVDCPRCGAGLGAIREGSFGTCTCGLKVGRSGGTLVVAGEGA